MKTKKIVPTSSNIIESMLPSGIMEACFMHQSTLKKWIPLLVVAVIAATFSASPAQAEVLEKTKKVARTTVRYKVVLPNAYDAAKAYPGILALGGGPQNMGTVDRILDRNFRAEAEKRGYIVVAPA